MVTTVLHLAQDVKVRIVVPEESGGFHCFRDHNYKRQNIDLHIGEAIFLNKIATEYPLSLPRFLLTVYGGSMYD